MRGRWERRGSISVKVAAPDMKRATGRIGKWAPMPVPTSRKAADTVTNDARLSGARLIAT